jgi:hypothetical protein
MVAFEKSVVDEITKLRGSLDPFPAESSGSSRLERNTAKVQGFSPRKEGS